MKYWIIIVWCFAQITILAQDEVRKEVESEELIDSLTLTNVYVSASRLEAEDPISFQYIPTRRIEETYIGQDPSTVLEDLSPSILSYSDAGSPIGNYVQFRLRGLDQTRITTTLNGIPLNDMIDQGVFFSNFADFGASLSSIQIQRGVGVTNGGLASYAGSINFESANIFRSQPTAELQFLTGSFNTLRMSGEVNTGVLSNDLAFYSRMSKTTSSGYKNNAGSDAYSLFFSGGYLGSKDIVSVVAFAGKTQNDQSYLPVLQTDIESMPKTNYNHPNDTDDFEQDLIHLRYTRILSDNASGSTSLYYGGARGVFPFGLDDDTQLLFGLDNKHFGILSEWKYKTSQIELLGGFHAYVFKRENFNSIAPKFNEPDYTDNTQKNELNGFAKINYRKDNWNFYGDIVLRSVALEFQSDEILSFGGLVPAGGIEANRSWIFFNPKIGLRYHLNTSSSLYASFGRTKREPTRTDILQGDGSAITEFNYMSVLDDQIVKAESVNDLEVGWQYLSQEWSVHVNYFLMNFHDEISQVGALAANSYVPLRQNVDKSYRTGLEWNISYLPSNSWRLGLRGSYFSTEVDQFDTGTESFNQVEHIFAPRWIISPELRTDISSTFRFSLLGRYVSDSFMELSNNQDFILPEYFLMNAQVSWQTTKNLEWRLSVNNLFNTQYYNDGAPVDIDFNGIIDGPGYRIQPPRHVFVVAILKL